MKGLKISFPIFSGMLHEENHPGAVGDKGNEDTTEEYVGKLLQKNLQTLKIDSVTPDSLIFLFYDDNLV